MARPASPPTLRVIEVVEYLCSEAQPQKLSDIIRAARLTQGTAHAIMDTLVARGWVVRNAEDKTYAVGPGLDVALTKARRSRLLPASARDAASRLSASTGYATTVSERAGGEVVITSLEPGPHVTNLRAIGGHVPYAAPFGPAFAAFSSEAEQRDWIRGGGVLGEALSERLRDLLEVIRERGYSIERSTTTLTQATQLLEQLRADSHSASIRSEFEEIVIQLAEHTYDETGAGSPAISSLAAPVFDQRGIVTCNIALHPFEALTARQIASLGRKLLEACRSVSPAA